MLYNEDIGKILPRSLQEVIMYHTDMFGNHVPPSHPEVRQWDSLSRPHIGMEPPRPYPLDTGAALHYHRATQPDPGFGLPHNPEIRPYIGPGI